LNHRIDFTADEYKIAGDGCSAAAGWLEVDARGESHGIGYFHASFSDGFASGHADLKNSAIYFSLMS
jgi:hypothetical protein